MYNFIFMLKPKTEGLLPSNTGQLIRGAILKAIREYEPVLSEKLHDSNQKRPYSISQLMTHNTKPWRTKRGELVIKSDITYKCKLGILTQELAERMVKISLQKSTMILQLATIDFAVVSIEIKKKTAKELLTEPIENLTSLTLDFVSPTYFNIAKQEFPMRFPDPRYLFMNLASLWNTFIEEKIMVDRDELFTWVEDHVSINAYKLYTVPIAIAKNTKKIGFKGWVKYQLSGDERYQRWIHILAKFAEFSNVGGNRTAGLGCVLYNRYSSKQSTKKANQRQQSQDNNGKK